MNRLLIFLVMVLVAGCSSMKSNRCYEVLYNQITNPSMIKINCKDWQRYDSCYKDISNR